MRLFLHLIISKDQPIFNVTWQGWLTENLPDIKYFDLDQKSENAVVATALKAVEQFNEILVFIESDDSTPGPILKIIKQLKSKDKAQILHLGNNQILQKLSVVFGERWHTVQTEAEVKDLTKNHFNNLI